MRITPLHAVLSIALGLTVTQPLIANTAFEQGRVIHTADHFAVLSQRERISPENEMLNARLGQILPALMAEQDLDMWLVINRGESGRSRHSP
ncbi:hypothetical protein [Alishewanella longhuensis]